MAGVTVTPPIFSGGIDENINTFIRRFQGFLDGVGINPVGAQKERAIGMLRSCLQGPAGEWYDENILGKRWKLVNILDNHGMATTGNAGGAGLGNIRARTMAQMNGTNSFRPHSLASTFANIGGNNAVTVGDVIARMVPPEGFEEDWTNSGGEPTDDPVNVFVGNNNPIVLADIRIGQAIFYFRNNYDTVLEERRKIHFGNLEQGDEPVKEFYRKLKHYGDLLHFGNEIVEHHFFRGLSPDNQLEVERIGGDKSIEELVKSLERVEKRKSEMKLGLTKRTKANAYPEEINPRIQIQELQAKIPKVPYQNNDLRIARESARNTTNEILNKFATSSDESIKDYPVIPDFINFRDESGQSIFQQVGGSLRKQDQYIKPSSDTEKMVSRIVERIEQQRLDKEIESLISKINNFRINDPDSMDTSNLIREIATDDDEYTLQAKGGKKESKSKGISIDTANLKKIIRELIIEELTRLGLTKKTTSKEIQKFSEAYSDDSMDIDLLRLDNKKDLASVEGVVEGKLKLPILIDSCCNKSVMPEEIYKELGLILDTNKICKLFGASTNTKSLGTVKNVKITLAPGCTITDDFAHMAITCDGKDFFIPIIPARDEHKKTNSPVLEALNH
nr:1806_t:CDS:2 [Entrophospora candida]